MIGIGLAIRRVVLVVIAIWIIAIKVLLVGGIAVVVITRLVVLYILRLGIAILVVVIGALVVGAKVIVVIGGALWVVSVSLLSVIRLEIVFEGTCEAFKVLRDVRRAMWARDTAMGVLIVFMMPEECFGVAELNSGIGV